MWRNVMVSIAYSLALFPLAGLAEIAGGYFVWLWLREAKPMWLGLLGAAVLFLYGIIPTLQPAHFGRVYATYGGIFVVLSLLWGWHIGKIAPDRFDLLGAGVALVGVLIIMYTPRG
jgi:small multidrug resistance family-3 protein